MKQKYQTLGTVQYWTLYGIHRVSYCFSVFRTNISTGSPPGRSPVLPPAVLLTEAVQSHRTFLSDRKREDSPQDLMVPFHPSPPTQLKLHMAVILVFLKQNREEQNHCIHHTKCNLSDVSEHT